MYLIFTNSNIGISTFQIMLPHCIGVIILDICKHFIIYMYISQKIEVSIFERYVRSIHKYKHKITQYRIMETLGIFILDMSNVIEK